MVVSVDLSLVSVPLALEDELFAPVSGALALEDESFASVSGALALEDESFASVSGALAFEDESFASVSVLLALEDELFACVSGALATEAKFLVSVSCCCFLLARSRDNILLKPSDPDGSFIAIFGVGLLGSGRLLVRMGMLCISFP